jgi:hypothetical protein
MLRRKKAAEWPAAGNNGGWYFNDKVNSIPPGRRRVSRKECGNSREYTDAQHRLAGEVYVDHNGWIITEKIAL